MLVRTNKDLPVETQVRLAVALLDQEDPVKVWAWKRSGATSRAGVEAAFY